MTQKLDGMLQLRDLVGQLPTADPLEALGRIDQGDG